MEIHRPGSSLNSLETSYWNSKHLEPFLCIQCTSILSVQWQSGVQWFSCRSFFILQQKYGHLHVKAAYNAPRCVLKWLENEHVSCGKVVNPVLGSSRLYKNYNKWTLWDLRDHWPTWLSLKSSVFKLELRFHIKKWVQFRMNIHFVHINCYVHTCTSTS